MTETLTRKGIQVSLEVHAALSARKSKKEMDLALKSRPREVTFSEIIEELLPELKKK